MIICWKYITKVNGVRSVTTNGAITFRMLAWLVDSWRVVNQLIGPRFHQSLQNCRYGWMKLYAKVTSCLLTIVIIMIQGILTVLTARMWPCIVWSQVWCTLVYAFKKKKTRTEKSFYFVLITNTVLKFSSVFFVFCFLFFCFFHVYPRAVNVAFTLE